MAALCVLRSDTGGSMNAKQRQTEFEQRVLNQQPGCLDFGPALDTMLLFWHTTVPAPGRLHLAPLSPPGNHVCPQSPHSPESFSEKYHRELFIETDRKVIQINSNIVL